MMFGIRFLTSIMPVMTGLRSTTGWRKGRILSKLENIAIEVMKVTGDMGVISVNCQADLMEKRKAFLHMPKKITKSKSNY